MTKNTGFRLYFLQILLEIDKNGTFLSMGCRQKLSEISRFRQKIGHLSLKMSNSETKMLDLGPKMPEMRQK